MANKAPYGERGYMIDRKGDITPINGMYGHEAFVRKRSNTHLSPINFVADNGWVLIQIVADHSVITLCEDTVTKQALSATSKVLSDHHRQDKITITNYNRETDIENQLISYATHRQAVQMLIKLKYRAETASFKNRYPYLQYIEVASRERKLQILEEKAKRIIFNKNYRVYHDITNSTSQREAIFTDNKGKTHKLEYRSWDFLWLLIVNADPTTNMQYLQWLVTKAFKNDEWRRKRIGYWKEDLESVKYTLEKFDEFKRKGKLPVEYRDISKFKDDQQLNEYIIALETKLTEEALGSIEEQEKAFFDKKEAVIFYESSVIRVIIPKSHEASCFFGRNSNWCTAIPKRIEIFADYSSEGPLYIIEEKKTKNRYQFHFPSEQFMDVLDKSIDWLDIFKNKPLITELQKAFNNEAKRWVFPPLMKSPTTKDFIYPLRSMLQSAFRAAKIAVNHPKPLSKRGRYEFLKTWIRINGVASWAHSVNTGAGEQTLSLLFDIPVKKVFDNIFDLIIKANLAKSETTEIFLKLINKIGYHSERVRKIKEINVKFKKKFGEPFNKNIFTEDFPFKLNRS